MYVGLCQLDAAGQTTLPPARLARFHLEEERRVSFVKFFFTCMHEEGYLNVQILGGAVDQADGHGLGWIQQIKVVAVAGLAPVPRRLGKRL